MASLGLAYLESDLDSDPEIVPESPPAMLSTESPPAEPINDPDTKSLPAILSPSPQPGLVFLPLPPIDQPYDDPDSAITVINTFAQRFGYAVLSRRSKRIRKGIKKTVRLCCDRWREP
ncbi:hypothetical protein N7471_003551 [Penicillium samsonianum]|uniref:uncharacterized protein n=1 Tax=Penicillium samsonianum TaxID=1882272 RepID=UPI002548F120|nr:uncharacterized protein N7471_003551 [Penicillium samsonianum]KAJ6137065.1 hypothetical protein N7471_003551 [Penicillium samsonianum]